MFCADYKSPEEVASRRSGNVSVSVPRAEAGARIAPLNRGFLSIRTVC